MIQAENDRLEVQISTVVSLQVKFIMHFVFENIAGI